VRTAWRTEGDGEFYCPGCGGDRNYRRLAGTRRFTVFNVPLAGRGAAGLIIECGTCRHRFGLDALDAPTTSHFSALLRDAMHTVALAVLSVGGCGTRQARATALAAVRDAGLFDVTEEELIGALAALDVAGPLGGDSCGGWLSTELHEALEPLGRHLLPQGRERLLLQGARIAVADGPYSPAERDLLESVGRSLLLTAGDTERLLQAAGAPS
jgi:hypothetical protein